MPYTPSQRQGLWLAAAAAILFSSKAILAKLTYRYGVDAVTFLTLRMLFSFPVFATMAVIETRRAHVRNDRLTWPECGRLIIVGLFGYYMSSFLDFWGLEYLPVGLERLILFLTPTLVMLIGSIFLKRHATKQQWISVFVCYAGMALAFMESWQSKLPNLGRGGALIFGSALSYALYMSLSEDLMKRIGSQRLVPYAMCASTVVCVIQFFILRSPTELLLPWPVYGISILNAIFCTVMPVYMAAIAINRIGAATTAQMSFLGPIALLILSYIILGEPLTVRKISGTLIMIAGITVLTRMRRVEKIVS